MKFLFSCANRFPAARADAAPISDVAQICNLLYRRIAFGQAAGAAMLSDLVAASGLQIRDTAECSSALLRLWLCRAVSLRG